MFITKLYMSDLNKYILELEKHFEKGKKDAVKFFREKFSDKYNEKQINAILKTNKPFFVTCIQILENSWKEFRRRLREDLWFI